MALVACGGDDDGGGNGSDEDYVRDICNALGSLDEELGELIASNPGSVDEIEELTEEMANLFGDLADDLDDANPPSDAADAHNAMVDFMRDAAEAFESGDISAMENLGEPELEMPADVEERLSAVAADIEECEGLDLFE